MSDAIFFSFFSSQHLSVACVSLRCLQVLKTTNRNKAWITQSHPHFIYGGRAWPRCGRCAWPVDLKFFDFAHPALVCRMFRRMGLAESTSNLLEHMWTHQVRYLQYTKETLPAGVPIAGRLLEYAWHVYVYGASAHCQYHSTATSRCRPNPLRSFAARAPPQTLTVRDLWHQWTARIGFSENVQKRVILPSQQTCSPPCGGSRHSCSKQQTRYQYPRMSPDAYTTAQSHCAGIGWCVYCPA